MNEGIGDVNSNTKGSGARYNGGKTRLDLIPLSTLKACADVFAYGERKYARWNWMKGMPWMAVIASLLRHLDAFQRGEDIDPESGLPHLGHIMCNVVMLCHYADHYVDGDDRPKQFYAADDREEGRK